MNELISKTLEQGIVYAAFVILLGYFLNSYLERLEKISDSLQNVCENLIALNMRVNSIENRIDCIERNGRNGN